MAIGPTRTADAVVESASPTVAVRKESTLSLRYGPPPHRGRQDIDDKSRPAGPVEGIGRRQDPRD